MYREAFFVFCFFVKVIKTYRLLTVFEEKLPSQMFNWVDNRRLAMGLKYRTYSCSKSIN